MWGALVIGQVAVQAGIISAPLVIVVATTGIASFAFPRYNLGTAYRMLRFPMLLLAGMLGLYGIAISTLAILIHLTNIRSFGIPYLSPVAPQTPRDLKDVFLRTPRWNMTHRPIMVSGEEKVRFPDGQKPDEKRGRGNRMSLHKALSMILVVSLCFLTGCWDRTELNDLAIELGWGLDQAKNNKVEISAQFIIPSKMGMGQSGRSNTGKSVFIESGIGKDTHEAVQMMQTKMSREIFRGHQRVILIGEKMAKNGLASVLDAYSRDPDIRLRADAFVIKGHTAKRVFESIHPLRIYPGTWGTERAYANRGVRRYVFITFSYC